MLVVLQDTVMHAPMKCGGVVRGAVVAVALRARGADQLWSNVLLLAVLIDGISHGKVLCTSSLCVERLV